MHPQTVLLNVFPASCGSLDLLSLQCFIDTSKLHTSVHGHGCRPCTLLVHGMTLSLQLEEALAQNQHGKKWGSRENLYICFTNVSGTCLTSMQAPMHAARCSTYTGDWCLLKRPMRPAPCSQRLTPASITVSATLHKTAENQIGTREANYSFKANFKLRSVYTSVPEIGLCRLDGRLLLFTSCSTESANHNDHWLLSFRSCSPASTGISQGQIVIRPRAGKGSASICATPLALFRGELRNCVSWNNASRLPAGNQFESECVIDYGQVLPTSQVVPGMRISQRCTHRCRPTSLE